VSEGEPAVDEAVQQMSGPAALPRVNGELAFDEPWQGRAFGTALALVRSLGLDWEEFRRRLIAAIEADPERPYWDSWVAALDDLVTTHVPG
jgi:nitrile hydratase accessory protein